ncbi:uncharacterized protein MEPE_05891 [Melanopsichium pennsylvanicum]|uniref:DUF747-domain-containing protein n=2 Tax=Melanopsichium pennsylvanicum TaxID=63383 RepID=A0AAJ5C7R4_9BASI|nr:conserved hypothetical protein [Melanopsichium pennsylvanicum 4]SNX87181.1 uncharacterized protein MEPE_05891 [Melanopsichium pennsylvanicum]
MKGNDISGSHLPLPHENDGAHHANVQATANGDSHHHKRASQETIRRESSQEGDLLFPPPQKLAKAHVVSDSNAQEHETITNSQQDANDLDSPLSASPDPSASHSRESTAEPPYRVQHNINASTEDDEDVWEDEEDSILIDNNGNIVYEGLNNEDSPSDFSDDADAEEINQHRRSYREATKQYRSSRRALLLSGLSSFASLPSSEDLGNTSPRVRKDALPSPPGSIFETQQQAHQHESYYQPHLAEAVNTAGAGSRAVGLRYEYDSGSEQKTDHEPAGSRQANGNRRRVELSHSSNKIESSPVDHEASLTPKVLDSGTQGITLGLELNDTAADRLARPPPSPRSMSSHTDVSALTPSPVHRSSDFDSTGLRQRRSVGGLAPPSLIFDNATQEPLEAYMTPRLSLSMLHEEPRYVAAPTQASEKHVREGHQPNDTAALARPDRTPFSLWDYLKEEVLATDFDATQEMKWERVTNFISIPFWMEKIIMFGFVVCLDSFLYTFTILPLRFGVAMWTWIGNSARWLLGGQKRYLHSSHKCDILKMLLIILSCTILSRITDASKMYHSVRGQDVVKLSVIFNVLEIADRLCCSFGQDLLDSLFSRSTLARRKNGKQPYLRPIGFFCLSLCYVLAHTLVLFYQLVTLNVAINSYDNALLTLLLSNQFVEIKSSVFKKFEKENVFQMACADIVERFQLTLMLSAIGLRNLIELSGGSLEPSASPLPASFTVFPSLSLLETVLTPVCIVLASECIVDWLKHAFITKFNHIRPAVYGRFMDVLCRDLVVGGPSTKENSRKHTFVDQSPIISRRLGFAALPLACLLVRLILQIIGMIGDTSHIDECIAPISPRISETGWIGVVARKLGAKDIDNDWVRALDLFVRGSAWALTAVIAWAFLVAIKLLLGTNLVSFASHRYATMHERENEENLNSKDRAPIGTNKDERSYDKSLGRFIDKPDDDAIQIKLDGTHVAPAPKDKRKGDGGQKASNETSLMEVSRYNMVRSRIW